MIVVFPLKNKLNRVGWGKTDHGGKRTRAGGNRTKAGVKRTISIKPFRTLLYSS